MATKVLKKSKAFYDSFFRSPNPDKGTTHYCPGCGHGNVHKFIAEALEDFNVADKTVFVSTMFIVFSLGSDSPVNAASFIFKLLDLLLLLD